MLLPRTRVALAVFGGSDLFLLNTNGNRNSKPTVRESDGINDENSTFLDNESDSVDLKIKNVFSEVCGKYFLKQCGTFWRNE